MRKFAILLFVVFLLIPIITLASWLGVQYAFEQTADEPFCTSCHAMEVMGETFKESVHGGNNREGFSAQCNDCHLPHDNVINYLITKVRMGSHDALTQMTGNPDEIDWLAKLDHSKRFVYDSGCLHCHKNLENTSQWLHEAYFNGGMESCLDCHTEIAHPGLAFRLRTQSKTASSTAD